jgi:hypothetical protein
MEASQTSAFTNWLLLNKCVVLGYCHICPWRNMRVIRFFLVLSEKYWFFKEDKNKIIKNLSAENSRSLRNSTVLPLGIRCHVTLCFVTHALKDPLLCSSTNKIKKNVEVQSKRLSVFSFRNLSTNRKMFFFYVTNGLARFGDEEHCGVRLFLWGGGGAEGGGDCMADVSPPLISY